MIDISKLYVVTAYSNHLRWQSRKELYLKFKEHMRRSGAKLVTVELALGDRPFEVIDLDDPLDRGLRTWDEIWHKEQLINYGVYNILPSDWEYVAWIDCDVEFVDEGKWLRETVEQLQHHQWIQMFQTATDLGPTGEAIQVHNGFVWSYLQGIPYQNRAYKGWHPGYAWAARREAFEGVGGLFEWGVAGAGDHHMALGLIGKAQDSYPPDVPQSYKDLVLAWEKRAVDVVRKDIGYVNGSLLHFWHGRKADRQYISRWDILKESKTGFNPCTDIVKDANGLWRFSNLNPRLRDDFRKMFRQRNEDSKEK